MDHFFPIRSIRHTEQVPMIFANATSIRWPPLVAPSRRSGNDEYMATGGARLVETTLHLQPLPDESTPESNPTPPQTKSTASAGPGDMTGTSRNSARSSHPRRREALVLLPLHGHALLYCYTIISVVFEVILAQSLLACATSPFGMLDVIIPYATHAMEG
jgi:hypothetical protein